MINDRSQIELILRQSGISVGASDEAITETLTNVGYPASDIATIIYTLRSTPDPDLVRQSSLRKISRSDGVLSPAEISALLGIEVPVEDQVIVAYKQNQLSTLQVVIIAVFSILLALAIVSLFMYFYKVGPFYVAMVY